MQKKKKLIAHVFKEFSDLPPRVVVFNIFDYISLNTKGFKEFDLFGYFKKDRFRNVWFLFSSFELVENSAAIVVPSKVKRLRIDCKYFNKIRSKLFEKREGMISIKFNMNTRISEDFFLRIENHEKVEKIIFRKKNFLLTDIPTLKPKKFPNLKYFGLFNANCISDELIRPLGFLLSIYYLTMMDESILKMQITY